MRVLAVLPFVADEIDPDANELARWLWADVAAELSIPGVIETRMVVDRVEISAQALGEAASQLEADLALGATMHLEEEKVVLAALLVDARGTVRAEWGETLALGAAPQIGRMLARAALLALGEDSSASPQSLEQEVPGEAVLRLSRAARRIDEGDAEDGLNDLLALAEELPSLDAPRRTLLHGAGAALGSDRMPAFFSALERFVELRPDDAEALLALGDYRAAHFDEPGARSRLPRAPPSCVRANPSWRTRSATSSRSCSQND